MIVVLVGLPGSGKGTQAKLLSTDKDMNFQHVAVGELLRLKCHKEPELGELLKTGNLLPEGKVNELVLEALGDQEEDYLLDGYPRSMGQYKFLLEKTSGNLHAIQLDLPEELLVRRIKGRYTCNDCFAVFNDMECLQENKVCDFCSGRSFSRRPDDKEEILKNRISEYNLHARPMIEEFSGRITKFDASLDPLAIFAQIKLKLLSLLQRG